MQGSWLLYIYLDKVVGNIYNSSFLSFQENVCMIDLNERSKLCRLNKKYTKSLNVYFFQMIFI